MSNQTSDLKYYYGKEVILDNEIKMTVIGIQYIENRLEGCALINREKGLYLVAGKNRIKPIESNPKNKMRFKK